MRYAITCSDTISLRPSPDHVGKFVSIQVVEAAKPTETMHSKTWGTHSSTLELPNALIYNYNRFINANVRQSSKDLMENQMTNMQDFTKNNLKLLRQN